MYQIACYQNSYVRGCAGALGGMGELLGLVGRRYPLQAKLKAAKKHVSPQVILRPLRAVRSG